MSNGKFTGERRMKNYIKIARPDRWIKNLLILPGAILACVLISQRLMERSSSGWRSGFVATSWLASCTMCSMSGWTPIRTDITDQVFASGCGWRAARRRYQLRVCGAGAGRAGHFVLVSPYFFLAAYGLWGVGILFNVPPFRSKDIPFLDVITESFNNAIRFLLGWFVVTGGGFPRPASSSAIGWAAPS